MLFTQYRGWPNWTAARRGAQVTESRIRVTGIPTESRMRTSESVVPEVPPHLKPVKLNTYHVLWEANWATAPDPDPALIKWIGGEVWVLCAQWDLTPLEVMVLRL